MRHLIKKIVWLLLAIYCISCENDTNPDSLFEKAPTKRIESKIEEVNTLLKSAENGWKFVYFPNDSQVGGFTYVFRFLEDNKVEIKSDFDDDTSFETSSYEINLGSTIQLTFNERSKVHDLASGDVVPDDSLIGEGYFGNFQFLVQEIKTDTIILRDVRLLDDNLVSKQPDIKLSRMTTEDINIIEQNRAVLSKLNDRLESPDGSVFLAFEKRFNGANELFTGTRFDLLRRIILATDKDGVNETFAFNLTPNGIAFNKPIKVLNTEIFNLDLQESGSDLFIGGNEADNKSIHIAFLDKPLILTDDNKEMISGLNNVYGYIDENLNTSTSKAFQALVKQTNENLNSLNFKLIRVQFHYNVNDPSDDEANPNRNNFIQYLIQDLDDDSRIVRIIHYVNVDSKTKSILKFSATGDWGLNLSVAPLFSAIDDVLTDSDGLYIIKESYTVRFPNTIWSFTSVKTPSIQVVSYSFQ